MPYRVLLSNRHGAEKLGAKKLGVIELSGTVTWPEIEAAMRALFFHPAWERDGDVLWDCRGVASTDVPPTDLPAIKAFLDESAVARSGGFSAVVVRSDVEATLAVLIGRMGPPSGRVVATFRRVEEALDFLRLGAVPEGARVIAES